MEMVKLSHVQADPMNEETALLVFEYRNMFTTCNTQDDGEIIGGFDYPEDLFILPLIGSIETRVPLRLAFAEDYKKYRAQVNYMQNKLNENLDAINQKIEEIKIKGR